MKHTERFAAAHLTTNENHRVWITHTHNHHHRRPSTYLIQTHDRQKNDKQHLSIEQPESIKYSSKYSPVVTLTGVTGYRHRQAYYYVNCTVSVQSLPGGAKIYTLRTSKTWGCSHELSGAATLPRRSSTLALPPRPLRPPSVPEYPWSAASTKASARRTPPRRGRCRSR